MDAKPLIERILEDEGITSGLDEREATLVVETLTKRAQAIAGGTNDASWARAHVDELCRKARRIARIVECYRDNGETEAEAKATEFSLTWPANVKDMETLTRGFLERL